LLQQRINGKLTIGKVNLYFCSFGYWVNNLKIIGQIELVENHCVYRRKTTTCPYRNEDRRGCDRIVIGFTITYAISAYHKLWIRTH
jgi:hypothetical protein